MKNKSLRTLLSYCIAGNTLYNKDENLGEQKFEANLKDGDVKNFKITRGKNIIPRNHPFGNHDLDNTYMSIVNKAFYELAQPMQEGKTIRREIDDFYIEAKIENGVQFKIKYFNHLGECFSEESVVTSTLFYSENWIIIPSDKDKKQAKKWINNTLRKGDYVVATKWSDGDPQDHWCVGYYGGELFEGERHLVVDSEGIPFRATGFRRCESIEKELGLKLIENQYKITIPIWKYIKAERKDMRKDKKV